MLDTHLVTGLDVGELGDIANSVDIVLADALDS